MKDIKKMLKDQSDRILPDKRVKEDISRDLGITTQVYEKEYVTAGGSTGTVSKKVGISIFSAAAALLIVVLCFIFFIVPLFDHKAPNIPGGGKLDITTTDEFYAYGAASVGALLADPDVQASAAKTLSLSGKMTSQEKQEFEAKVTEYLALAESLLSDGNIEHETVSGTGDYEYTMTVHYKDLLGNTVTYKMYYNKIFVSSETDDEETEEKFSIEGVLELGNESYAVEGEYKTSSEEDETGEEISFRAYLGENSYIMVEQEHELETEGNETETEKEYVYSLISDDQLLERTKVEYEQEEGETEVKMSVENFSGGEKIREDVLEFSEEGKEKGILRVKAKIGDVETECRVQISESGERYQFMYGNR